MEAVVVEAVEAEEGAVALDKVRSPILDDKGREDP